MSKVNIEVKADIVKSSEGEFIEGRVEFFSTPSNDFITYLLDNKIQIPIVLCSRDGNKCPTPVTELQAHNGHAPSFSKDRGHTEQDMINYSKRIINVTVNICEAIKVETSVDLKTNKHTIENDEVTEVTPVVLIDTCESCGTTENLEMCKGDSDEVMLCPSCKDKAEHLGQQAYDEAKDEGKTDDDLPF